MSVTQLKFAEARIKTSGGEFAVRGLSLEDIACLVRLHKTALNELFDKVMAVVAAGGPAAITKEAVVEIGQSILSEAPHMISDIIALATDGFNADVLKSVKRLPIDVQFEALQKIGELTFESEAGAKKVFAAVLQMVRGTQDNPVP